MKTLSVLLRASAAIITCALVLAPRTVTQASATPSWDAAGDFSAVSNPNGAWSYGWSTNTGSAFNLDTFLPTSEGLNVWSSSAPTYVFYNPTSNTINPNGTDPIPAHTLTFHPGPSGQNAIVRWTAPHAGVYHIAATFTGRDFVGPTTTNVAVLKNGVTVWDGEVTGYLATQSFSGDQKVHAGDTIDFTVGYGNDGTYYYDSTGLSAHVSLGAQIPTP